MSDIDLHLGAIQVGDADAFAHWLAGAELPLRRSLRRFARFIDTEAVMQEALLRVWQVAGRCEPDGQPDSLLRFAVRIAQNLALSEVRRMGVRPTENESFENPGPIYPTQPPDPFLRSRIWECIGKLPNKPRISLRARIDASGGQSDKKLADRLGMRLNTFLQNVTRARNLLTKCLRQAGVEVPV